MRQVVHQVAYQAQQYFPGTSSACSDKGLPGAITGQLIIIQVEAEVPEQDPGHPPSRHHSRSGAHAALTGICGPPMSVPAPAIAEHQQVPLWSRFYGCPQAAPSLTRYGQPEAAEYEIDLGTKDATTFRQQLTHTSNMPARLDEATGWVRTVATAWSGRLAAWMDEPLI
jgi:hypothetical protein